ncbi:glycoside hydrolase family protein [Actinoplanes sp. SE50]|uniref:TIM-barrel domain-containing protein n=1 Tax=unclassified Actinoplanes TaxID=2626549 RepID=UPI00023EC2AC|nr:MULTISPECIES: TIM-barrel domain-containing protein [unclassified Actinoplanes]AEV84620.1 glycoside hydrolase family 31 [Actinoplanes sp. SE50/110]ATO83012.1 glycoside hydrolase family protein [Actinoplanes sp. SE50]SLM00420.1 glycoside hydrolase [Actinoplanes sp. SE50/110]
MLKPARVSVLLTVLLALVATPGTALAAPRPPRVHGQSVQAGHLRVQVLSPTLLRLEYAADDHFEDQATFNAVDRAPGRTWFRAGTAHGELRVWTGAVTLHYRLDSGPVTAANTTLDLTVAGRRTSVHPGFGMQPADPLGGWYRGLDYYAGQAGPVDQLSLHPGLLDRQGWYLLDDTATALRTGNGQLGARPARTGAYQDGYLFGYGHDYPRALADLRTLTGPSVLPPEWAFGTWFSKYQAYSTADYRTTILPAFKNHRVPLDSLVMDTDWKAPNQWAGWNWNPGLFPDPDAFLKQLRAAGVNATLNVHAAISGDDPRFAQAQATAKGRLQPSTNSFAPNPYRFDWGDPDQAAAFVQLHQPFEQQGVRQWWLDYCCDDSTVSTPGVTPDSWVNELYRREGDARGVRGFALSRIGAAFPAYTAIGPSGPWAEHRSTVHFTGDTEATFATLAFAAAMTPGEGAAIGQSYVSHDIGSFAGRHLSDDLYLRWVQLGAFQPILRLHSDHGDRLPWEYDSAVSGPAADFLRLRESLVPYLYTAARQNYDTGLPMARALYLNWPEQSEAYRHDSEYLLGDSLLVAPVTTPGLSTTAPVWFPPGTWTDLFTGETFRGPVTRTVGATPDHMPVYVRGGGILAQRAGDVNVATQPRDRLTLTAYPHGSGTASVYEDNGDGLGYRTGRSARIPARYTEGRRAALTVGPVQGTYPGAPTTRQYTVAFADVARPHRVTADGHSAAWTYDPGKHLLTVALPAIAAGRAVTVEHDGATLTVAQKPAVDTTFTAPDGLQSGATSTLVATATNHGPGAITDVAATVTAPAGWVVTPKSATTAARLAPGATFTATYAATPAGAAPRTQPVTVHIAYRNPDGTATSAPAALTVPLKPVAVTFRVLAPPGTPPDATLYVPGSIAQLGPWDPGKQAMTDRGGGVWEATVSILDGTDLQYKYTRGTWDRVEEWGSITGTDNRSVSVDGGLSHTMLVDDTSTAWGDASVPDSHKAIRYWRDPLVVTTEATARAVTVRFERDIRPTGADYSGSVTVAGPSGTVAGSVAEPSPGTLVFTPGAALPAGTYTGTVTGVTSAVSDGVPIQKPYTFTFAIAP